MAVLIASRAGFAGGLGAELEQTRLRRVELPAAVPDAPPSAAAGAIEREVHSELVLVCPELRRRLQEFLPERQTDGFIAKPAAPPQNHLTAGPAVVPPQPAPAPGKGRSRVDLGLLAALLVYTGNRLLEFGLAIVAMSALFTLLTLVDLLVRP
jgi:hypothetical protein